MHIPYPDPRSGKPITNHFVDLESELFTYRCYLPRVGYVWNYWTGKMERREIIGQYRTQKNQLWHRQELPKEFRKWEKQERNYRKKYPSYINQQAEKIRLRELDRIKNGAWFMLQGEPFFLTGAWYMHLNYSEFDFGFPDFRVPDREVWYFLQWIYDNPKYVAAFIASCRRIGKTADEITFVLWMTFLTKNGFGGMQSTSEDEMEKLWETRVERVFRKLPRFMRPFYDVRGGISDSISFDIPDSKKRDDAHKDYDDFLEEHDLPLVHGGRLDYASSKTKAYDSEKLHAYIGDEDGKNETIDIRARWSKIMPCFTETGDPDSGVIGKALCATTVDKDKEGEEADISNDAMLRYKDLVMASIPKPDNLNPLGQTSTLAAFHFISAHKHYVIDKKTGISDEERARKLLKQQKNYLRENNPRQYIEFCRKYPETFKEACMTGDGETEFPEDVIHLRLEALERLAEPPWRQGNFEWEDEKIKDRVIWVPDSKGKWKVGYLPSKKNRYRRVSRFRNNEMVVDKAPIDPSYFSCGTDPIKRGKKKRADPNRGSAAVSHIWMNNCPVPSDMDEDTLIKLTNNFIVRYENKPDHAEEYWEDMIKQCMYYGCQILTEKGGGGDLLELEFERRGYQDYLMKRPDIAIASTANKDRQKEMTGGEASHGLADKYVSLIGNHVKHRGKDYIFAEDLQQMLVYDFSNREKYDAIASMGMTRLAADGVTQKSKKPKVSKKMHSLFPKHKLPG